jgi:Lon protease (S16) C-terminal proteolytic domain
VLIPEENAKDLVEIADSIKSGIEIVPVSRMDEVLAWAMTRKPEPIEWNEITTTAAAVPKEAPVGEEAQPMPHGFAAGAGFPGCGPRAAAAVSVMALAVGGSSPALRDTQPGGHGCCSPTRRTVGRSGDLLNLRVEPAALGLDDLVRGMQLLNSLRLPDRLQ